MKKSIVLVFLLLPLLVACGEDEADPAAGQAAAPERVQDFAKIARGGELYQQNCAECHGSGAQGAPDWRQRDADGMFPPPPLNGTGHAWHHPRRMLHYVIAYGSPGGQGNMPAWGDKLSDEEIDDIIAWFQSRWPDQVYAAWQRIERTKGQGS
jgi:mono/diheme cytochrome c family protein